MSQTRKLRGVRATDYGLELLKQAKADKDLSYEDIAGKAERDVKTVQRFFSGRAVDPSSASKIVVILDLKLQEVVYLDRSVVAGSIEDLEQENRTLKETIAVKDREIEQLQAQANMSVSEIKRLEAEKVDIEMQVKLYDESIKRLKEYANKSESRMSISKQTAHWLKTHKESLLQESVEFVLTKTSIKPEICVSLDSLEKTKEKLYKDMNIYLKLIYHCLDGGSHNLLFKAIMQAKIPRNLSKTAYIEAFKFIKEQRATKELSIGMADELAYYLDQLIALLPTLY